MGILKKLNIINFFLTNKKIPIITVNILIEENDIKIIEILKKLKLDIMKRKKSIINGLNTCKKQKRLL